MFLKYISGEASGELANKLRSDCSKKCSKSSLFSQFFCKSSKSNSNLLYQSSHIFNIISFLDPALLITFLYAHIIHSLVLLTQTQEISMSDKTHNLFNLLLIATSYLVGHQDILFINDENCSIFIFIGLSRFFKEPIIYSSDLAER